MAMLLAPYNNSMRLGQGFNSYTQQICLDKAVLPGIPTRLTKPRTTPVQLRQGTGAAPAQPSDAGSDFAEIEGSESQDAAPGEQLDALELHAKEQKEKKKEPIEHPLQVMPWVKPQIVTYSSRFVDKLSDITDAMNISGSLSIKTATIGGKANGSYIDSDKFKSSDINFHLQVKVTNQIHDALEYNDFNKIDKVEKHQFPEVYGDCFISGWEEGGELNAVISMKVHDKSKVFDVKAELEAEMNQPSISGKVEGKVHIEKSEMSRSTETTISVTWSGGGSIKDPTEDWTIASLKKAAAAFPDLVAITPQRTYAILTRYTALASFHEKKDDFSPLDYESAGIYTRALLDHYMDYKAMWKAISHATYELKGNRATIELGRPDEEMFRLATIKPMPVKKTGENGTKEYKELHDVVETDAAIQARAVTDMTGAKAADDVRKDLIKAGSKPEKSFDIKYPVFSATFAGLIHARKVCRFEMAKIVNEVDLVAKNPKMSTDATRDAYFLNPLVFEQLLPIVRSLSPESKKLRVVDPNATLLLGYLPPAQESDSLPPLYKLYHPITAHDLRLQTSLQRVAWAAKEYRIEGVAGVYSETDVHSAADLTNDMTSLNAMFRPSKIQVWMVDGTVHGIRIHHANEEQRSHGTCNGEASHTWNLAKDGSEIIVEIVVREGLSHDRRAVIASIAMATSDCNIFDSAMKQEKPPKDERSKNTPPTEEDSDSEEDEEDDDDDDDDDDDEDESEEEEEEEKKEEPKPAEPSKPRESSPPPTVVKVHRWARPEDGQWSLRGFLTFKVVGNPESPAIPCTLGVIWGKDAFVPSPMKSISPPLCKGFLGLGRNLQDNIRRFKTVGNYGTFVDKFLMGNSVSTGLENNDVKHFNALDSIDVSWTLKTIAFASREGMLTGLKVWYTNGREFTHGTFEREVWRCDVGTDLVVARLTAGRKSGSPKPHVDTVEFIRSDSRGGQSAWPLSVSTLRYLGEGTVRVSEGVHEVVEQAPKMGDTSTWTIRGFYGETNDGIISRLGVIWGRG